MADNKKIVDDADEGEAAGKGKLFLIIGIVVLLLIGIGGAAFFLLGSDDEASDEEAVEEVVEDEGPKVAQYHAIPPDKEAGMVISLPPESGFKQAQITFRIFTYSPALVDYLKKNDPMIRHHILNTLSLLDGKMFTDKAGREKMQEELKKMLSDVLSKSQVEEEQKLSDKVEAVYFTTFILQ